MKRRPPRINFVRQPSPMSFSAGVHNRPATDGTPGHPGRCHGLNGRNAWTAHPCRQFTGGNLSSKRLLAQSSAPGQSPPIHGPTGFAAIAVEPWEMPWEIQTPKPSRTSDSKKSPGTLSGNRAFSGLHALSRPEPTATHRNSLAFPGLCWHSLGFLQLTPALASKPVPSIKTQATRNMPANLRIFASIAWAVFHVASSLLPTSPRTSRGIA